MVPDRRVIKLCVFNRAEPSRALASVEIRFIHQCVSDCLRFRTEYHGYCVSSLQVGDCRIEVFTLLIIQELLGYLATAQTGVDYSRYGSYDGGQVIRYEFKD